MCASTATVACQEFRAADVCAYAAARISAAVPAIAMAGMLTVARLDALGEGVSIHQLTNPSLRPAPERSYCASALSRLCHRLPRAPAPAHRRCHARSPRFQNRWRRRWTRARVCRQGSVRVLGLALRLICRAKMVAALSSTGRCSRTHCRTKQHQYAACTSVNFVLRPAELPARLPLCVASPENAHGAQSHQFRLPPARQ